MTKRIQPNSKQKMMFVVHFIIFAIACFAMWSLYDKGVKGWAYPWPAWITAAWSLALLGHGCIVFRSYEDKAYDEWLRQTQN